ncbi:hypothetical protein NA57DRAFT_67873 [Rhizodiscina lignyota]|uniref:Breast carcinoma amplified sequence 2 n=1 Tax=Rhizodiscina lignyota TaxID=1504668 RepID=A0A9P4I8L7_9PEZI|nr:hypothetical protein NA57DRAFT_67873 [Rhizodiscina lignyota]
MPLITQHTDALAFVDPDPKSREAIEALVKRELPPHYSKTLHPSVPASYEPQFTPALTAEHERIAAGAARSGGIDEKRYESVDEPSEGFDAGDAEKLQQWREALKKAYTISTYMKDRATNLELLEEHGKNAWLVGNWQMEPLQRGLDTELAATKTDIEAVQAARRARQAEVGAELAGLEKSWRDGVGRVVEVEVANETLRQQILGRMRQGAA